ncbi:lysosomal alpha-mannosidase isoform X2 [Nilaparvata lugens]|uniref:lysosomal alpha-mannosidase isoform X2 n=1 Tax=Nilaparvata lugens TaxID=108931 RepID=UPI00193DECFA|nr:lysosomal alpha-mannosidase isoform X2 [Nilaparvata lugens]
MIKLLILICVVSSSLARPETKPTCGYQSCHPTKKGMLNVHLVPHTHDDVGWLKTLDEYYYGSKPGIQRAGVQYILDSVVEELLHDPNKRFIYVETAFFWKWWQEQDDHKRHQVKALVNAGRLEFIGGAWAMNDEATTNYQSTIDQFTWGFRKLDDTFGACGRPKIGWQIDPFGHSRELASLMAQFGFDGLLFGRLDYQDKATRVLNKHMEMVWQGSPTNLGSSADLFTSVLFNTYSAPPSFCFDILCNDEPIVDNKKSPKYNADERVQTFLKYIERQHKSYTSNNILITMGDDFNYQSARSWYKNLDKLIRLVNEKQSNGSNVNLLYSTPSCYVKAVNEDNLSFTTKKDDFFPYASDPNSFWTGYFTSRPTIKYFERKGNNFLQICKQLYALADLGPEDRGDLNALRSAMGVMQHHDAITGTEKQLVAFDYARILSQGMAECEIVVDAALRKIIAPKTADTEDQPKLDDEFKTVTCPLLNVSQCATTEENKSFVVTVYNPLSKPVTHYVRLPVIDNANYTVLCPMGKKQVTQLVPISDAVKRIPGRASKAEFELVFRAKNLPPLGFRSYYVSQDAKLDGEEHDYTGGQVRREPAENIVLGDHMSLSLTLNENGELSSATFGEKTIKLSQGIYYYSGAAGNNEEFKNRSSGAYIFRPTPAQPILLSAKGEVKQYKGPIVEEVQVIYSNWVSQTIRRYTDEEYVEVNWIVGPIPIDDNVGKEIIIRYESDIKSNGVFYTDSNGRETLKRVRDFRPTWKLELAEKISGNYYPVTSRISIKDEKNQFSVLTDRAQGGSSLNDGQIELMVHRRLLHDDAFGVGEALNETAYGGVGLVAVGSHYLTAGGRPATDKFLAHRKLMDSWMFFTPTPTTTFQQWQKNYKMEYSGLKGTVPSNVKILTLEPWKGRSLLLRLENIFEVGEDELYSKEAIVNLQDLFSAFKIVSAQETVLGANLLLKDMQRLKWNSESNYIKKQGPSQTLTDFNVTLKPMQIRTFIIEVQRI